jgi:hypothetical protein
MIKNAVTTLAVFSLALHTIIASGHDWKHPNLDAWYSSLSRPGVPSCCSKNDCHVTDAELRSDGSWWARVGEPVDHPNGHRDWVLLDWVPIDDHAIVRGPDGKPIPNAAGEPVICHNIVWGIGGTGIDSKEIDVYCFVIGNLS